MIDNLNKSIRKIFPFTRIYKLKDIQDYMKTIPLTWDKMSIQPLEVNYLIEDKISRKEIYQVYNYFKKSRVPLYIHISLLKVTDDCYIKFTDNDAMTILGKD